MSHNELDELKAWSKELLISSEGISMCEQKLRDISEDMRALEDWKSQQLTAFENLEDKEEYRIATTSTKDTYFKGRHFPTWPESHAFKGHEELTRDLRRWSRLLRIAKQFPVEESSFDLEALRAVPIIDLMLTPPKQSNETQALYLCPFHDEKTPSFRVYKKDNHFHCFGCQAHGNVITFVMKQDDCKFIAACKRLQTLL